MFGLFKKKKQELPPLSNELLAMNNDIVRLVVSQASVFEERPLTEVPFYSGWHDEMLGAYCCGFVNGMLQVNRLDRAWAQQSGIAELDDLAARTCALSVVIGVAGLDRVIRITSVLPQFLSRVPEGGHRQLEAFGGDDGIHYAKGLPFARNGNFLHFLKHNVEDRERRGTSNGNERTQ